MYRETGSIPVEQLIGQLDKLSLTREQVDKLRSIKIMVWYPTAEKNPSPQAKKFAESLKEKLEDILGRKIISSEGVGGEHNKFHTNRKINEAEQIIVVLDQFILNTRGEHLAQLKQLMDKARQDTNEDLLFIPLVLDGADIPGGFSVLDRNRIDVTDSNWLQQVLERMVKRVETGTDLVSSADAVGQIGGQLRRQFVPESRKLDLDASDASMDRKVAPIEPWQSPPPSTGAYSRPSELRVDQISLAPALQPTPEPTRQNGEVIGRFVRDKGPDSFKPQLGSHRASEPVVDHSTFNPPQAVSAESANQGQQEKLKPLNVLVWYPITDSQIKTQAELLGPSIADQIESLGMTVTRPTNINQKDNPPNLRIAANNADLVFIVSDAETLSMRGSFQSDIRTLSEISTQVPPGISYLVPVNVDESKQVHPLFDHLRPLMYLSPDYPTWLNKIFKARAEQG